jgi:hypothetical protein
VTVRKKKKRREGRKERGKKKRRGEKEKQEYPITIKFFLLFLHKSRILIFKKKQYGKYQIYPNR